MQKHNLEDRLNDLFGFGGRVKVFRTRPASERARTVRDHDRECEAAKSERRARSAFKRNYAKA